MLLSFLCFLGLIALTGCAPRSNRFGIVFISNEVAGPTDIYRIPDNTQSEIEQLTFTPTIGEYHLLVSKNGDKIIFEAGLTSLVEEPSESAVEERQHIYLLDTASKKLVDITNVLVERSTVGNYFNMDWEMDWSLEEDQFVLLAYEGGGFEIESFLEFKDFDGANKRVIPVPLVGDIPSLVQGVKWSPDGKKLALTRGVIGLEQQLKTPGFSLLVYDLDSGKLTRLADYQENCYRPKWSPTSQQVVTTCASVLPYTDMVAPDALRIFSVEKPGQPYERLALSPCLEPSWSPDGKQIAFVCYKDDDHMGLFIINSDGNGIREVKLENLESPAFLRYPIWSPDGTQILYVAGTDAGSTNIYSVNPDSSNNRLLTNQVGQYKIISTYPVP
jgi:Tol biopolymer transport system component